MVNEENVKHLITSWLNTFDIEVYWEKKNKWNYPIFKSDNQNKPDLIVKKGKYCLNSFAIEVKDAESDMNLLNASPQILKYAKSPTNYFIDSQKIIIDGFLVATQYSIQGHLYQNEVVAIPTKRQWSIDKKQTPDKEYDKTLLFIRTLWRFARANEINLPTGALLSNILNDENNIAPLLFYKTQKWSAYEVWNKFVPRNPFGAKI